ncbi:MAG: DUF177 domain-containing protein [Magnetococcales bacterium]|nr:DUF177 domain-containing protein [Magnetococcales bacterium]
MTGDDQQTSQMSPLERDRDLSKVIIELGSGGLDTWRVAGMLPVESLTELGAESEPSAPGLVNVTITKEKELWRVQGNLEIAVTLVCSRCLVKYTNTLMVAVDRFFSIGHDPAEDFGQSEMDTDVVYLECGKFSPLRFAEEEFILVLPMIPLCADACVGLCQNCGADKNSTGCSCPAEKIDNPFAILGNMKLS